MTDANPPADRIGELIGDPQRRAAWRSLVAGLVEASLPGGPLDGHLFHGTASDAAGEMSYQGMDTTFAIAGRDACETYEETEGTHWGTPKVAAFYAEDRIESRDDPDLELAIVVARRADLEASGEFAVDAQTLDCPLYTRLDRPQEATDAAWEGSSRDWRACLDAYGTLLVLGPVEADRLRVLRTVEELHEYVAEIQSDADYGPQP